MKSTQRRLVAVSGPTAFGTRAVKQQPFVQDVEDWQHETESRFSLISAFAPNLCGLRFPRRLEDMRIGFLFNHDQIHQVAHSLPIAIAMADGDSTLDLVIATTNPLLRAEVERILSLHPGMRRPRLVQLEPKRRITRAAVKALNRLIPAAKLAVYRDHLDFFRSLDALVVAEKTSAILKTRYGLQGLKLIHTRHGAGDRAVGFDKASASFDFVLVSGPKIRDRLITEAGVPEHRLAIVGYPKFDLPRSGAVPAKFQGNTAPIILYNPHVSPHLSSWYRHGRAVLDFFLSHPQYNLIFAPHIMLFERRVAISINKMRLDFPGAIEARYRDAPNIHVDLGSADSTNMTYVEAADIYLGDVSSQIYEFLRRPRPSIFLNSHQVDHRSDPNYLHWSTGSVIDDPARLESALDAAVRNPDRYRNVQQQLFRESIDLSPVPSTIRAATAIRSFLGIEDGSLPMSLGLPPLAPVRVEHAA